MDEARLVVMRDEPIKPIVHAADCFARLGRERRALLRLAQDGLVDFAIKRRPMLVFWLRAVRNNAPKCRAGLAVQRDDNLREMPLKIVELSGVALFFRVG